MKCPKCWNVETRVVDSRVIDEGRAIRRRRECESCQYRFTTFERKSFAELMVVKKDWMKELYDRQKLKKALLLAFAKRKISSDEIENIICQLEQKWLQSGSEVASEQIGVDMLLTLKEYDPVAYVRFASVYMAFDNLSDFQQIIE